MFPTHHAAKRFQQRVAPSVTLAEAARTISNAASNAAVRTTPRWWTPVDPAPGLLFLYPASLPGVCLLARGGAIVTVFERSQCRQWNDEPIVSRHKNVRSLPYRRPSPGESFEEAA